MSIGKEAENKSVASVEELMSISENDRIETLLDEVKGELEALNPRIEALEETLQQLRELKAKKQKLLALKMSLESVLNNFNVPDYAESNISDSSLTKTSGYTTRPSSDLKQASLDFEHKVFYPDKAFDETKHLLKKKGSLNYEMYRAIVFNGGKATTEEVRQYLIEHNLTLPNTGQTFDQVSLTQVSSRVNYLVRKGIISAMGRGYFVSNYGWGEASL